MVVQSTILLAKFFLLQRRADGTMWRKINQRRSVSVGKEKKAK